MAEHVSADYRSRSLWLDLLAADSPDALRPRPPLDGDTQCDVAIAGAGLTGLWTAYYLAVADPSLRIVVAERDIAGFGASGRNGGWASAGIAGSPSRYARRHGIDAVRRATRATNDAVDEIGRVAAAEGIECHFAKRGSLTVATSEPQRDRLLAAHDAARRNGTHNDDDQMLDVDGVRQFATVSGVLAGAFT
ncbi:MAG: NAD(P)/FAD-dependent oxidoreductase, partial [Ilumatobacteraceae bacterium]